MDEDSLTSRQRARSVGRRHGVLDAQRGASGPSCSAVAIVGKDHAGIYAEGWREGYDATMAPLMAKGTRVSIPGLMPGERLAVRTTGKHRVVQGEVRIECMTPGGTSPLLVPVRIIKVLL